MPETTVPASPTNPKPGLYDFWNAYLSRKKGPSRIRTGVWIVFMSLAALVAMFWIAVEAFGYTAGKADPQAVVAVMGVVVSPVVSVVASYFGITMAASSGRSDNSKSDE